MRIVALVLVSIAVSGGAIALAQSEPATRERAANSSAQETPEEIVVRGRRLTQLRFEMETARERAYDVFNAINSNDDFDIHCRDERKYHSRATNRVCRARFEDRISADAGQEYLAALRWACPDPAQLHDCMFSGIGASAAAVSAAQGVEGEAPPKRDMMAEEILRLARQDLRFGQAILDYYEASQQYETARKRRED